MCALQGVSEAGRAAAYSRMQSLGRLGPEYAHLFVPCVPSPDFVVAAPTAGDEAAAAAAPAQAVADASPEPRVPALLQRPLLKAADGDVAAVRSGGA